MRILISPLDAFKYKSYIQAAAKRTHKYFLLLSQVRINQPCPHQSSREGVRTDIRKRTSRKHVGGQIDFIFWKYFEMLLSYIYNRQLGAATPAPEGRTWDAHLRRLSTVLRGEPHAHHRPQGNAGHPQDEHGKTHGHTGTTA